MNPNANKLPDRFKLFRSDGVRMSISATLGAGADFTNWIALRIDALPWLTHKSSVPLMPPPERKEDAPEPIPRIESLAISVSLNDLQIGAWFDDTAQAHIESNPSDGLCLILPKVQFLMEKSGIKIHADGPIQAALLNIDQGSFQPEPSQSIIPTSDYEDMVGCDRKIAWLGDGSFGSTEVLQTSNTKWNKQQSQHHSSDFANFLPRHPYFTHT
eukprot:3722857-Ditylum_brightwellii.AAC.1